MSQAFVIGATLAFGAWLVARGMFPAPVTLSGRLAEFAETERRPTPQTAFHSLWGHVALRLLRTVRSDDLIDLEADTAIIDTDVESHAVDKLNAGLGGAVLLAVFGFMFGVARGGVGLLIAVAIGFVALYLLPDVDLKRKAATRRDEFNEALTAFVSLVAISVSGGGGVNTAMLEATKIGDGWCFDTLRRTIEDSALHGDSPWTGFDSLGRRLAIVPLIELAGALSLAGTSGARVTETLTARAESGRQKEHADALTAAEKKSESMNIPVAAMMLGWALFMGYPAVAGMLGS